MLGFGGCWRKRGRRSGMFSMTFGHGSLLVTRCLSLAAPHDAATVGDPTKPCATFVDAVATSVPHYASSSEMLGGKQSFAWGHSGRTRTMTGRINRG